MKIIKKILRKNQFTADLLNLYFLSKSFLKQKGWFHSRFTFQSIDAQKKPIPWLTYAAIHFIESRLNQSMDVYEFGSGNSTLWFANKVNKIISVEHDSDYFKFIQPKFKNIKNTELVFAKLEDNYTSHILETNTKFDVVIVDGRKRVECAKNAIKALKDNGIIIWDDTARNKYSEGCAYLHQQGFKSIDFNSLKPISTLQSQTSIFYKSDNCFNI